MSVIVANSSLQTKDMGLRLLRLNNKTLCFSLSKKSFIYIFKFYEFLVYTLKFIFQSNFSFRKLLCNEDKTVSVHVWFLPDSGSHPVSLLAALRLGYGKDSLDSSPPHIHGEIDRPRSQSFTLKYSIRKI